VSVALTGPGNVTGTVSVTGAPSGFAPTYLGVGACPAPVTPGIACANPVYTLAVGANYTLSLAAGQWDVAGFYENNAYGGVFLSPFRVVTVPSGGTVAENFTVKYRSPATLQGTVQVLGVPTGVPVYQLTVLLCPSFAPYTGGIPSIACVNAYGQQSGGFGATSAPYQISGLPPGKWTAFPGYCSYSGCVTNAKAGKKVELDAGQTGKANVTTPYILPGEGLLEATVTVTGAPTGFSDPVGLTACPVGGGGCDGYSGLGHTVPLLLADGQWNLQGMYVVPPFYNAVAGPTQVVTITDGAVTSVNVTVPYQVLGGATGPIHVTGKPTGVKVTSYTVLACPGSASSKFSPECVNEYSGPGGYGYIGVGVAPGGTASTLHSTGAVRTAGTPRTRFNRYQLSTLTPGQWTLYPGYSTAFGSYSDPVGTTVTVTAGQTVTQRLSVPYQAPAVGVVYGKVLAVGVPQFGFQTGVQACSAPPSGLSCPGERFAFNDLSGGYTLPLPPGNWWVFGFVDVYTGFGQNQSTSPAQEVTVSAGTRTKVNFTVAAPLS
jgi:hypothetical protein